MIELKDVISEIMGMYEEIVDLKAENGKLRKEIDNLKPSLDIGSKCEEVDEANKFLKLKFFNKLTENLSWVKNNIFNEYSLPDVYASDNNGESKYVIPFGKWSSLINANDINDDILNFMSVDEVVNLFCSQLKEIYDVKVARFKERNQG